MNVELAPETTTTSPDGSILPFGPADAVMMYSTGTKEAVMV